MSGSKFNVEPSLLREMLAYDPETGILRWRERPPEHFHLPGWAAYWNRKHAGKIAGSPTGKFGHLIVGIRGRPRLVHRLIWAIVHDEYPEQIDHINNNPADNRLCNLRACDQAQNQHNQRARKTNKSGFKGVSLHKTSGRWRAAIFINSKQQHLGLFDSLEDAHKAYCEAAARLHGEFANFG